jgi:biotin carboxyl carrier protein
MVEINTQEISSPEGLDQVIETIPSKGILTLIGVIILFVSLIIWGFLGKIPEKIHGKGILIEPGGIFNISSLNSGQIDKIIVDINDTIKKGQIVAYLKQAELENRINNKRSLLANLKKLSRSISNPNTREKKELFYKIQLIKTEIMSLEEEYDFKTKIISPYNGRILEILVDDGSFIKQGHPILDLELISDNKNDLRAVIYVSSLFGKKVSNGMTAYIDPAIVKKEEFGYIEGEVVFVSEFPASNSSMMRVLKNEKLIESLSSYGAPIEIQIKLLADQVSNNGYKWTLAKNNPIKLRSGTICEASIVIRNHSPISLILPFFH